MNWTFLKAGASFQMMHIQDFEYALDPKMALSSKQWSAGEGEEGAAGLLCHGDSMCKIKC